MKKLLTLVLCAAMLLGVVPTAFAAKDEAAEPTVELQDTQLTEAEDDAEDERPEPPEEIEPPISKEELALEEDEIRAELDRNALREEGISKIVPRDTAEPDASSGTVNITVNLPSGVTASNNNYYNVYLYSEAQIDEDGKATTGSSYRANNSIRFSDGSSSGSVSVSVPAGRYIVAVNTSQPAAGLKSGYTYFNADGTVADNEFVAKGFAVSDGGTVSKTVTLPKAPRTISGTVTFSQPLDRARTLRVYAYTGSSSITQSNNSTTFFSIAEGAKSVDFTVGLERGTYYLEFYIDNYGIYTIFGDLDFERNSDEYAYFNLLDKSVSGLKIDGDPLLGEIVEREGYQVDVTVKLPEKVTERRRYRISVTYAGTDDTWDYDYVYADPGSQEISESFYVYDEEYSFAYEDVTDLRSTYYDPGPAARYKSETGITTDPASAQAFTFTENSEVVITEPACYKVTGTIERGSYYLDEVTAAVAFAEFENGERYAAYAVFKANESEAAYTIYVPQSEKGGTFQSYAAWTQSKASNSMNDNTVTEPKEFTLKGNTDAGQIDLSVETEKFAVTGTITLPAAAEKDIAVYVYVSPNGSSSYNAGTYVIKKGETTAKYTYECEADDSANAYASLVTKTDGIYYRTQTVGATKNSDGTYTADIEFPASAKITGTVYMPEGVKSTTTARIYTTTPYYSSSNFYLTIFDTETSGKYEIIVPDAVMLNYMYLQVTADSENKVSGIQNYVGADWTTGNTSSANINVDGSQSGVDFNLQKAILLSGRLIAEDGTKLEIAEKARQTLYTGGNSYRVVIETDGTWVAKADERAIGTLRYIEIDINSNDIFTNAVRGDYYYNADKKVVRNSSSEASSIEVTEEGVSGLDIYVLAGWEITGQILAPEGGYVRVGSSRPSVGINAYPAEGGSSYSGTVYFDSQNGPWTYSILVPKTEAEYYIQYSGSSSINRNFKTNIAFGESQKTENFTVSGDTEAPDITLGLIGNTITGSIRRPADYKGSFYVYVYVVTSAGNRYGGDNVYVSSSASSAAYSIAIPASDESETYTMYYTTSSDGLLRTGYLTEDNGISKNSSDQATFSFENDSLKHNFTPLTQAPVIQGKLYIPDGVTENVTVNLYIERYTGYYYQQIGNSYAYINSSNIKSDANGKYIDYKITSNYEGDLTFIVSYSIDRDPNEVLFTGSRVYVYDGYYMTANKDAKDFTYHEGGDPVECDITLQKGVFVRGNLYTNDGKAVAFSDDRTVSLNGKIGSYSASMTVKRDGSWYASLFPSVVTNSISGTVSMTLNSYFNSYTTNGNIVDNATYYYSADKKVVTKSSDASSVTVTSDGLTGVDIYLDTSRDTITGKISNPEGVTGTPYATVIVTTYDGDTQISTYSKSSSDGYYSISIPSSDTGTTYTVRYDCTSSSELARYGYLKQDGTMGYKPDDAYKFSFATDSAEHDFVLLPVKPYIQGKIYVPDGLTETFTVRVSAENSKEFEIDPTALKSDKTGKYFEYSLTYNYISDGETYYVSYYISEDKEPNGVLYTNRTLYVKEDGTLSTNYSSAYNYSYSAGDTNTVNITLMKAIKISGKIVDENGKALKLSDSYDAENSSFYVYADGLNTSFYGKIAEDGSWYVKASPDNLGEIKYLRFSPGSAMFDGVVAQNYYYKDGAVSTSYSDVTPLTLTADGLSGINIRVTSGWKVTGTVSLPKDGYLKLNDNSITMSVSAYGDKSYSSNMKVDNDEGPWSYTIVVPKTEGTYTISLYWNASNYDSNIMNETLKVENVEVKGDTQVDDIVLHLVKYTVTGKITKPSDIYSSFSVSVYVKTDNNQYTSNYAYFYGSDTSKEYSIAIPETETSTTYTVYYYVSSSNIDLESYGYLTQTGVSANKDDAYKFTFGANSDKHDFKLINKIPLVAGKIYIPDGVTDTISVYVYAARDLSGYISVDPSTAKTDTTGKYVEYAIKPTYSYNSYSGRMYYTIYTYNEALVSNWYNTYVYVKPDGTTTWKSYDVDSVTYERGKTQTQDIKLATWHEWDDQFILQSAHGVPEGETYTYTYTYPGECTSLTVSIPFADCQVTVNGNNVGQGTGMTRTYYTNTLTISITPSGSNYHYYGFGIDSITANGVTNPQEGIAAVYTEAGATDDVMLEDLNEEKTLTVVFVGASETAVKRTAVVALYDADGKFIASKLIDIELDTKSQAVRFNFEDVEGAAKAKIMLLDENSRPMIKEVTIEQ